MENIKSSFEIVLDYMSGSIPVNLDALCKDLNIELSYIAMDDNISGEIELKPDGNYAINVNKYHHTNRQHFTIAHEIGHFIHHRNLIKDGIDDTKMYRSENIGKYYNKNITFAHEREANTFAASLLMPKEQVTQLYSEMQDISLLAKRFSVSEAAMQYRLQGLGLI